MSGTRVWWAAALLSVSMACGVAEGGGDDLSPDGGVSSSTAPRTGSDARGEGADAAETAAEVPLVLFLGDSLTAGYGLDPDQAYPALIGQEIRARGWQLDVLNAGVSGETTAGGLRRLDWVLGQSDPALVLLALGGNDGLRGVPVATMISNLRAIVAGVRERSPESIVVLAGMQSPPNMGAEYIEGFRAAFPLVAREDDLPLVPFLLEGVGGVRALNQADGIHPTAEGQRALADNVWAVIEPLLEQRMSAAAR